MATLSRAGTTLVGALVLSLTLPATIGVAQDDALEPDTLDEITVTAQRREQDLMDVPVSVIAWDGEALERAAISNIMLLADMTPGLVASGQSALSGSLNFFIRGIGSNAGGDPAVGYYVDEIYVGPGNAFNTSFIDLERVEVLKGPQGTLWGRNTTGGAINVVTKGPTDELEAEVFMEYGDYDTSRAAIAVSGPISDTITGRITLARGSQNSFTQNILTDFDEKTEESFSGRAQIRVEPSDKLTIDLSAGYTDDDSKNLFLLPIVNLPDTAAEFVFNYFNVPPNPDLFTIRLDQQPVSDYEGLSSRLDVNYSINDKYRLRWLTGYNENRSFRTSDFDGNFLEIFHATSNTETDWMSSELQLQYSGQRLDWTVAAYHYDERSDLRYIGEGDGDFFVMSECQSPNFLLSNQPIAALCPLFNDFWTRNVPDIFFGTIPGFALPSLPFVTENFFGRAPVADDMRTSGTNPLAQLGLFPNSIFGTGTEASGGYGNLLDTGLITNQISLNEIQSSSAYGQANWRATDKASLTFGIRYTEDKKSLVDEGLGTLFTAPLAPAIGTLARDAWTPKIGLELRPNDNTLLFGSITSGFKGGGFGFVSNITGEFTTFDEESVIAYEVGYKATLADGKVRLDTAAFHYDYDDMQIELQFPEGPITENLEGVEVTGLDVATDWSPLDDLTMGVSLNFLHSEIIEFSGSTVFDPTNFGAGQLNLVGNPLPRAPEWSGSAYSNYTMTPATGRLALSHWAYLRIIRTTITTPSLATS